MRPPIPRHVGKVVRSVVLTEAEADRIDAWRREQYPGLPTISAAIRHFILNSLDREEMNRKPDDRND